MQCTLGVTSLLALTSIAGAGLYQVNRVDAGGVPGSVGSPIRWTTGVESFEDARGPLGVLAPTADGAANTFGGEFDNYFGLDTFGPTIAGDGNPNTVDGYSSNANLHVVDVGTGGSQSGFRPGRVQGVWYSDVFVNSGSIIPQFYGQPLFILSFTLPPGAALLGTNGIAVNIREYGADGVFSGDGVTVLLQFGHSNANTAPGLLGSYWLDYVTSSVSGVNGTFNGGTRYQVYVAEGFPPTPSAGGVTAVALAFKLRRRRTT